MWGETNFKIFFSESSSLCWLLQGSLTSINLIYVTDFFLGRWIDATISIVLFLILINMECYISSVDE